MIDHAARRQLELENPEVTAFKKIVMDAITNEVTAAFRKHDLTRRDILTDVSTIINKIPVNVLKNPV